MKIETKTIIVQCVVSLVEERGQVGDVEEYVFGEHRSVYQSSVGDHRTMKDTVVQQIVT